MSSTRVAPRALTHRRHPTYGPAVVASRFVLAAVRIIGRLAALVAGLLVLVIVVLATQCYLATTRTDPATLRAFAGPVGTVLGGQRTERMSLDVRLAPDERQLDVVATLTVRSLTAGRQRFYFLLNDGLHLRGVGAVGVAEGAAAPAAAPRAYRLWLLTIVDVGTPVAEGDTVQLTVRYGGRPNTGGLSRDTAGFAPRDVALGPDALWYPSDLQGFFTADVAVTVPADLTVVHNGVDAMRTARGLTQRVQWTTQRAVPGLALVAGDYTSATTTSDGATYRLYRQPDIELDDARVLESMAAADRVLTERFGPAGLSQNTLLIARTLGRGFNDGGGLMGLPLRDVRQGDMGFGMIAHETAHNWWGGTVAGRWLDPNGGSEWMVEGFAEAASLVATEAVYGHDALVRRLAAETFDPAQQQALAGLSVIDNAADAPGARATIYRKGGYVAFMLRQVLGNDTYVAGLRQFLDRHRYQTATLTDLQQALQDASGTDLQPFLNDWVRSDRLADLSLDSSSPTELTVNNLGTASLSGDVDLWVVRKDGSAPTRSRVQVGQRVPFDDSLAYAVLDPVLAWPDMQRENNRFPRRTDPRHVAVSPRGELVVTRAGAEPWARATVSTVDARGRTAHAWDFPAGLLAPPAWTPDGSGLVASAPGPHALWPAIITLAADGAQRTVGAGLTPAPDRGGRIYAARGDRIVTLSGGSVVTLVAERPAVRVDAPLPSPDGSRLVYLRTSGTQREVRTVTADGADDRVLLTTDRDRLRLRWAPDGSRLYAVMGGDWDWRVVEIPLAPGDVRVLASGAAEIGDLAVSPDGARLAFTAAEFAYPQNRRALYVMQPSERTVRPIALSGIEPGALTWSDADTLLVVTTAVSDDAPFTLPQARALKRVRVADGSVEDALP